jgi:hypothetical protein
MRPRLHAVQVPAQLAVGLFVALSWHAPWIGQWNWTLDTVIGSTVLSGPLTASFAAWVTGAERKRRVLQVATPRGWLVPVRCALEVWATATSCFAILTAGMLATTALTVHGGRFTWWVWLLGPAVLMLCALLGALAGHYGPHFLVAVLVGPAVFVFGTFGGSLAWMLLRHGPQSGSLGGLDWDPVTFTGELAGLVGLSLAIIAWFGMAGRRSATPFVLGPLALVLAVAFPLLADGKPQDGLRYVVEPPTACTVSVPVVCVAPSDRHWLAPTARVIRQAAAVMSQIAEVPHRYEYLVPGYALPRRDVGVVTMLADGDTPHPREYVGAASVAEPSNCAAWDDPDDGPPQRALDAMSLVAAWITQRAGGHPAGDSIRAARWLRLPVVEQTSWLRTTYARLTTCDLGAIRLPWQ